MSTHRRVEMTVNGEARLCLVEPRRTLAEFLREDLSLTGTHVGCEHGVCGACTVIVDGDSVRSCLTLAVQADGADVLTIEGVAHNGQLDAVQEGFWESHSFQCGFCTPGIIMTTIAFLDEEPEPTAAQVREVLAGNLCRCTGYQSIVDGVMAAARRRNSTTPVSQLKTET